MTPTPLRLTLAAILAVSTSASALAQPYSDPNSDPNYQAQQRDYQDKQQDYQAKQQDYQAQQQDYDRRATDYQARKDTYSVQRDRYADDRAAYERQRADYDDKYGSGAWDKRYGFGYRPGYSYSSGDDHYRAYRDSPCERRQSNSAVTGGLIGALAGAAIGSNVAGRGDRTGGAVLGAVAGGAVGAAVGSSSARCDTTGYWFSYDQTVPYRVASGYGYDSRYRGDYDRYRRMGCRMALAPAYVEGSTDYRYVRVCPDSRGRYRITG